MGQNTQQRHEDGETVRLAKFCTGLEYESLDDEVIEAAKKALVDTLAAAYAGIDTEPGERILSYVDQYDSGEATVIGNESAPPAQFAALANGTLAHALDVDDGHRSAAGHPGSAVIPAALATAEKTNASGTELITAIVAGYEGMVQTAKSVQTSHRERGFHATATCGCFGAAAAVSCILDLDETETAHAIGLAGTQAGGLFEFLEKGSMAKRFHPGRAAMAGILAGELAATGFDGPDTIIEGKDGFARAFTDEYDLEPFENLGDPFSVTENYLKAFPCCRHIHGPIEAVQTIRDEGVTAADVESIRVETYGTASHHDKKTVENLLDTQMSIPYGVAVALVTGSAKLAQFDPSNADNPEINALIDNVDVVKTDEMEAIYPETRPARVVVTLHSGEQYEEVVKYPLGAPEKPLSREQIEEKFHDITGAALSEAQRETIIENAFSITEYDSVATFTESL
ncbi:2-methylcitrate dehydratase [Natrinema sp. CBA1119]|uniref:MmgE/PrpD family protein n=1 Tax=Natrinema sp. CBA1119 TaxID=1608465 RepID=UPI000BF5B890|nr:MmgE/PrpD family protein [Natrinema sp. CBA1119]PGF13909.1 2-methylcitrate dehydratase [Natrinema sp. CBA1119]